jgi:hypothetical protein
MTEETPQARVLNNRIWHHRRTHPFPDESTMPESVDPPDLRRTFATLAVPFLMVFGASPSDGQTAQDALDVAFEPESGVLTLHAVEAPLDAVLAAIGAAAGIEIIAHDRHDTPVTLELTGAPIKTALEELLGRRNYTMAQDPKTHLPIKLWLMSSADVDAFARAREAQRLAEERARSASDAVERNRPDVTPTDRIADRSEDVADEDLAREILDELRALGPGESDAEILDRLGIEPDEQEELLQLLDDMASGKPPSD